MHFVADHVPAHLKSLAIDPLAVRIARVRPAADGVAREARGAVNQHWYDHQAALLGKPAGELALGRQTGRQAGNLFGRLIGVGQGDDASLRLAFRFQQQAFAGDAFEHRPANLVDGEDASFCYKRRLIVVAETLHPGWQALIYGADLPLEALTVAGHRLFVGLARRWVSAPILLTRLDRFGDLSLDIAMAAVKHSARQITLPGQRLGLGKLFLRSGMRR